MSRFTAQPDDSSLCSGCTVCCRWPGDVLFNPADLPAVADYLNMDERTCADTFFELSDDRHYLKTAPTEDGGCIFITPDGCMVYPHRPGQCRSFPYEWQRPEHYLMAQCRLYRALVARQNP